jgi:hypothetical protein
MTELRSERATSTFEDSNHFVGQVALKSLAGGTPAASTPEFASPLYHTGPSTNGNQDADSERSQGGCLMNCFDSCFAVEEGETEWREVPLRLTSSFAPADGQLGSTDNSIKTSK